MKSPPENHPRMSRGNEYSIMLMHCSYQKVSCMLNVLSAVQQTLSRF